MRSKSLPRPPKSTLRDEGYVKMGSPRPNSDSTYVAADPPPPVDRASRPGSMNIDYDTEPLPAIPIPADEEFITFNGPKYISGNSYFV